MGSITTWPPSILLITSTPLIPPSALALWHQKISTYLSAPLAALRARGATVELRSFHDATLTPAAIAASYTHVLFLAADSYIDHMPAFTTFLTETLPAAQQLSASTGGRLRVHNPPALVAWNANKTYLAELGASSAGVRVPRTAFLDPHETTDLAALGAHLAAASAAEEGGTPPPPPPPPVVLKPSIAASGHSTHLIANPRSPTPADAAALERMRAAAATRPGTMLMVQEYLARVTARDGEGGSGGEWSVIVVAGRVTHAVRKRPREGEFRINSAFKGVWEPMAVGDARVPGVAVEAAERVWAWLGTKEKEAAGSEEGELLYARVDGVVGEDGEFVLMEVELIEPWLWLVDEEGHPGREGLRALVDVVMGEHGLEEDV